ncbi:ribokinase [Thiolinea disciformis]|uniref:ribokinase n=1 Tax=Thiolinea disciformis TaxID=125614 RepID=UPI000375CAE9|nr:ribokinase [Thiolinea disciformis]
MRIFNYGSINIDHVYRVPHLVRPGETLASTAYHQVLGGKGANQSIALARAGATVAHIGRYHPQDQHLLQPLFEAGVETSLLQALPMPSGHALIQVDDQAENAIVLYAGANHSFVSAELASLLQTAALGDWLLLQNECSCTREMIETAFAKGLKVAFNPAPMNDQVLTFPLEKLAVLFVNQVEVMQLLNSAVQEGRIDHTWLSQQLQDRFPQTQVVVTLGAQGAACYYQGVGEFVPALNVKAVDTTGAGDTFNGYYLAALNQGLSIRQALQRACLAAALCVQQVGASSSIPTQQQVDQLEQELAHEA